MTRDELLEALESDMGYVQAYRKKEEEYLQKDSFTTRSIRDQKKNKTKWLLLIGLPIGFVLLNAINPFKDPSTFTDIFWGVVIALIASAILNKKEDKTHKAELAGLGNEMQQLEDAYYKNSALPKVSQGIHKTERFYYYVSNFIADDLKECAKLYHQEEQNERIIGSVEEVADSVWDSHSAMAGQLSQVNQSLNSVNRGLSSVNSNLNSVKSNTERF